MISLRHKIKIKKLECGWMGKMHRNGVYFDKELNLLISVIFRFMSVIMYVKQKDWI